MGEGIEPPEQCAAISAERDRRQCWRSRVHHTIDDDWRRLDLRMPRWHIAGMICPGDAQPTNITSIDLRKRGIASIAGVAASHRPVAGRRPPPRTGRRGDRDGSNAPADDGGFHLTSASGVTAQTEHCATRRRDSARRRRRIAAGHSPLLRPAPHRRVSDHVH